MARARDKKLIALLKQRWHETVRRVARSGGVKSRQAKREKPMLSVDANVLLNMPGLKIAPNEIARLLEEIGEIKRDLQKGNGHTIYVLRDYVLPDDEK